MATSLTDRPMVPGRRLVVLLGGLAMFGPFSIDTIFPAFGAIAGDFEVGAVAMQQTISVYLFAFALMSLAHGAISDALGRKRVILVGTAVFALASVGCALAPNLLVLLVFRVLQGLSAGAGVIVGRAVVRDLFDGDDAQRLMSQVSIVFGVAPALAPVIGGAILGWTSWQVIFWFLAVFGLALCLATWRTLPETHPPARRVPLHPRTLARAYRTICTDWSFVRLAAASSFNFASLFLYISSAPAFVVGLLHQGEQDFWKFFVPMIGGMVVGSFASGRLAGKVPGARMATGGFALCAVAAAGNVLYNALAPSPTLPWAVIAPSVGAFGIALAFPVLIIALLDLYPDQRGTAASMQSFSSLATNAVLAGVISPLLSGSGLRLAVGSACLCAAGWVLWHRQLRVTASPPRYPADAAAYEPIEEL